MSKRYKDSMRTRRIVSGIIFLVVVGLIIGLIVVKIKGNDKSKTEDLSKKTAQTSEEQASKTPEAKTTEAPASTTESTQAPSGKVISFDTADAAYAQNHKYCVGVNRQENVITVYAKGDSGKYDNPIKAFLCSCGLTNGNDTPAGTFKITDKVRWLSLVNKTYGQYTIRINSHIWFHSVPYEGQDPSKLEYEEYNKLGENASLGCVRVNVADAKWLYDNLDWQTIVVVYDSEDPGPLGKPKATKIDVNSKNRGWDPTDPSTDNPWNS